MFRPIARERKYLMDYKIIYIDALDDFFFQGCRWPEVLLLPGSRSEVHGIFSYWPSLQDQANLTPSIPFGWFDLALESFTELTCQCLHTFFFQ